MVDNKNTPAFPVSEETIDRIIEGVKVFSGVTKLEFFACNAPNEIPSWFVHTPPEWKEVSAPDAATIQNEDFRKQALDWVLDPIYDLPQELDWFQDAYERFWDSKRRFAIAEQQARYFQWRVYYAEQLLTHLSKPKP